MTRFRSLQFVTSVCAEYSERTLIALPDKPAIFKITVLRN
jgi:hypothetical protein